MIKRIAISVSVLVAGMLFATGAQAQPGGGGCVLQGTASFSPGLPGTPPGGNFKYSFSGTLSPCQADPSQTIPASATVSAGKILTISGAKYQEPIPTGTGSCAEGTTAGTALVKWADKTQTVISYTTQSATGGVEFGGTQNQIFATVVPSVNLKKVGGTGSYTFKTTRFQGAGGIGALTFSPQPDPTACQSSLKSASITGFVGLGSSS